jgi:signal peptidase I
MDTLMVRQMPVEDSIRFYHGRSMAGTFRPGDCLTVTPLPPADVRPGDVVVYRWLNHNGVEEELVHRVMCARSNGLIVRGDNNPCNDSTLVTENNLVGSVSHVYRGGKRFPVRGRWVGLVRARVLHGSRRIGEVLWHAVRYLGRRSYRWFRKSGLVARLWRPSIVKVQLVTDNGPLVKYVWRNRTVASHWVNEGRFRCRKPYDLVISGRKELRTLMESHAN